MANGNGETIMKFWPILIVAFGLAVSWGSSQTQLSALAQEVDNLKKADVRHDAKEAADSTEVQVLKANQQTIKEDIRDIKETQKEQSKKLNEILAELKKD